MPSSSGINACTAWDTATVLAPGWRFTASTMAGRSLPFSSEASENVVSCLSCCTTLMPPFRGNVSEPFAPFSVMASAPIVAVTPCGKSTGIFATRDIFKP